MSCLDCVWDLGLAAQYAVYGSKGIDITVSSGGTLVEGIVGIGGGGGTPSMTFSGGGMITGRLDYHPGTSITISGGSTVAGGLFETNMNAVHTAAVNAATKAAGLSPTQIIGSRRYSRAAAAFSPTS